MDRGAWWAKVHRVAATQTKLKQQHAHTRCCLRTQPSARWVKMIRKEVMVHSEDDKSKLVGSSKLRDKNWE